jgi:hypothetical protein
MKATRRQAMVAALAVPAVASAGKLRAAAGPMVVYDPALVPPPAAAARPIEGDRIRFARAMFAARPSLVIGVSRSADALLIAEVAREAGYVPVSQTLDARYGWALAPRS